PPVQPSNRTNLIINYLPQDMTEMELADIFSKFGNLRRHKIIRDLSTGFSFGYGFVDFMDSRQAQVAQILLDGRQLRGKRLKVSYARPRSEDIKNSNLYVSHLPSTTNESQIRGLFGPHGQILDVNILINKATGLPKGVAFVRFCSRISAEKAQKTLDGVVPMGCSRPIEVKFVNRQIKPPFSNGNASNRMTVEKKSQSQCQTLPNAGQGHGQDRGQDRG
ncbi:hypothetical protein KR067_007054, partial [Drosophila pandora]